MRPWAAEHDAALAEHGGNPGVGYAVAVTELFGGTAVLEILCCLWPAARRHLVWLTLVLAVATTALTPITTEAGEWLYA